MKYIKQDYWDKTSLNPYVGKHYFVQGFNDKPLTDKILTIANGMEEIIGNENIRIHDMGDCVEIYADGDSTVFMRVWNDGNLSVVVWDCMEVDFGYSVAAINAFALAYSARESTVMAVLAATEGKNPA